MKDKEKLITKESIKSIFDYREDGFLIWKIKYSRKVVVGKVAGYRNPKKENREMICLSGKMFYTHRLIFFFHNGWWPEIIDHADRNPENNRIENLRPATCSQNNTNCKSKKNSTSKYLGVYWSNSRKRWIVTIKINSKDKQVGSFKDEKEAALAWNKMAKIHYGEFANLNTI
jgi:hypothetical protein